MNPNAPIGTPNNPLVYREPDDYSYRPTYRWQRPVQFDLFWLVFPTFGPMTAALAQNQQAVVPNEADFECRRIMYHIDAAAAQFVVAAAIIPNITIQIQDSGSGRNLLNNAGPLASIACAEAAVTPMDLPWPKIFARNSTITITLTNFDAAAATNNIRITMAGRKIFS